MAFTKGDDPKRNLGGRPKGSRNKSRSVKDWGDVTDKYSVLAVEKAIELIRKGSEVAKRDMSMFLLETHKKILAGKVECPDDFKAIVLRHSAEALDTLVGMMRSQSAAESTKKLVTKFMMTHSMESVKRADDAPEVITESVVPAIKMATSGGKKVVEIKPATKPPEYKSFSLS